MNTDTPQVTDAQIASLLSAASVGSDYWARFVTCPYTKGSKTLTPLVLPVVVEEDDSHVCPHVLDRAAIERGVALLPESKSGRRVLNDLRSERYYADTGDVFLQLCLLGEVIYG